jgi:hypothetical protein
MPGEIHNQFGCWCGVDHSAAFIDGWEARKQGYVLVNAEGLRDLIVDKMLNDGPEDTVYDVADRILAAIQEQGR